MRKAFFAIGGLILLLGSVLIALFTFTSITHSGTPWREFDLWGRAASLFVMVGMGSSGAALL
jgi:hypothetical protein